MKISRSTGYALVAVGFIAQNHEEGTILASRITDEYNIPLEYLLKILQQLVRANILRSKRGPRGGFTLSRPASEITMLDLVESIDGPLETHLSLAELTNNADFSLKMESVCREATINEKKVFEKTKLSDMIS